MFENEMFEKIPVKTIENNCETENNCKGETVFDKLQAFILLSIMLSWSCWMLLMGSAKGVLPIAVDMTGNVPGFVLFTIAMCGMLIIAVIQTVPGRGLSAFNPLPLLGKWKKNLHWYPVAVLVPLLLVLLAPGFYAFAGGSTQGIVPISPDWVHVTLLLGVGVLFAISLMLAGPGYLMPMLEKMGMARSNASFVATALTIGWLFPLFMLVNTLYMSSNTSAYMIELIPLTLAFYYLYYTARTDGILACPHSG